MTYFLGGILHEQSIKIKHLLFARYHQKKPMQIYDGIRNYCNDPISNFTRNRKLHARTLIECIINFSNHSTLSETPQFFFDVKNMPTPSALCQRRKLLDPDIFKRISHSFLCNFDNYTSINGYRILAQDGSDINIPFKDDDTRITYNSLGIPC